MVRIFGKIGIRKRFRSRAIHRLPRSGPNISPFVDPIRHCVLRYRTHDFRFVSGTVRAIGDIILWCAAAWDQITPKDSPPLKQHGISREQRGGIDFVNGLPWKGLSRFNNVLRIAEVTTPVMVWLWKY